MIIILNKEQLLYLELSEINSSNRQRVKYV